MKRLIAVMIFSALALSAMVYADTTSTTTWVPGQNVKIVKATWTTDSLSVCAYAQIDKFDGFIFAIQTDPTGTVEANYDVYPRDYVTGLSLLGTSLENRSATATELVNLTAGSMVPSYGPVGFSISGAGDLETGDVYFYIQVPK